MAKQGSNAGSSKDQRIAGTKKGKAQTGKQRNGALSGRGAVTKPEALNLEDYFREFVVLAQPLGVWSKPDGRKSIVTSIDDVIAVVLHLHFDPSLSPLTFRVPDEVERFARVTVADDELTVVVGNHLEEYLLKRQLKGTRRVAPRRPNCFP